MQVCDRNCHRLNIQTSSVAAAAARTLSSYTLWSQASLVVLASEMLVSFEDGEQWLWGLGRVTEDLPVPLPIFQIVLSSAPLFFQRYLRSPTPSLLYCITQPGLLFLGSPKPTNTLQAFISNVLRSANSVASQPLAFHFTNICWYIFHPVSTLILFVLMNYWNFIFLKKIWKIYLFIYLEDRVTDREGETDRKRSYICWFTSQTATWPQLDQAKVRSLDLHPDFPCGSQGPRHLGCLLLLSQVH